MEEPGGPRLRGDLLQIAPSILASDFLRLGDAVAAAEGGGADRLHLDVMDGRFVPNISFGTPVLSAVRSATRLPLEAHLMIVEPDRYVGMFADLGVDMLTVHAEVAPHLYRTLQHIHDCGKRAGVAINPGTPWRAISEVLELADLVLVMTVNPGFGGQQFIEGMLPKIGAVRAEIDRRGLDTELEVDGGIGEASVAQVVEAGARILVAGTSVFGAPGGAVEGIRILRELATGDSAQTGMR